ncbi:16430_t:CDS:2, partial [Gigaspora margarita]
ETGPQRPFVREKLMHIKEEPILPPRWVLEDNRMQDELYLEVSLFFSNLREKKKKERESMGEADFLEYKRNFETKMGVPTTPHKKELKKKSLALIEYA